MRRVQAVLRDTDPKDMGITDAHDHDRGRLPKRVLLGVDAGRASYQKVYGDGGGIDHDLTVFVPRYGGVAWGASPRVGYCSLVSVEAFSSGG
jgi:hypothetical protein